MNVHAFALPELVQAIVTGAVVGVFYVASLLAKWMIANLKTVQPTEPWGPEPTAVTGPIPRLVSVDECKDNHSRTAEELRRGSAKMDAHEAAVNNLVLEMQKLRGEMTTGFAQMKTSFYETIHGHEDGPLHRGRK